MFDTPINYQTSGGPRVPATECRAIAYNAPYRLHQCRLSLQTLEGTT